MTDKQALRAKCRTLPRPPQAADEAICRRILALPEFQAARSVLAFYPMAAEPDIRPVLEAALAAGKQLSLPRCLPDHSFIPTVVMDLGRLVPGVWGIPAPPEDGAAAEEIDLALVPGVAFDAKGGRLGHGAGYYDRFLQTFPGVTVGICFAQCVVERVPAEAHDRPVELVLTEAGLMRQEVQHGRR